MPLRAARVGRVGVIGHPVAKTAVVAKAVHHSTGLRVRKAWLTVGIAFNLALLGYFKYAGFLVSSAENVLSSLGIARASSVGQKEWVAARANSDFASS